MVEDSLELWRVLIESLDMGLIQRAAVNSLADWFSLVIVPDGKPLPRAKLFIPRHVNSFGSSGSGAPLCDISNANPTMRIAGSHCIGILASKWTAMNVGGQTVNHLHVYLTQLLQSGSATSRQVAALALSSTIEQVMRIQLRTGVQQSIHIPPDIIQYLSHLAHNPHQTYFDELSTLLQTLRSDSTVLVESFQNLGIQTSQYFTLDLNNSLISPEQARSLALQAYPAMLARIQQVPGRAEQLSARQSRILERATQVDNLQKRLTVTVMAVIAESLVQFGTLPSRLDVAVNPLMESVSKEKTYELQKRSAKALALLMCIHPDPATNQSLVNKIVELLRCLPTQDMPVENIEEKATELANQVTESSRGRKRKVADCQGTETTTEPATKRLRQSKSSQVEQPTEEREVSESLEYRGAKLCLLAMAEEFKESLFTALPQLDALVTKIIIQYTDRRLAGNIDSQYLQSFKVALNLLVIFIPVLSSPMPLDELLDILLPHIILGVTHSDSETSDLASLCVASACKRSTVKSMQIVIGLMLPLLEKQDDIHARLGVCNCLHHITTALELDILPWVVFLIIPILGRMSDPERKVRERITYNFATMVKLMPLESSIPDPEGLDPTLVKQKQHERHFLEQLLDGKKLDDYDLPLKIDATLRSYQKEGVNWLAFLNKYNLHGILCDDMGLGKTLQTICIMASDDIRRREKYQLTGKTADAPLPSLVVCPSTLVSHWEAEIQKFCQDRVTTLRLIGPSNERKKLRDNVKGVNVVITSYEVIRNDVDYFSDPDVVWNYCILDEGHIIKNPKAKLTLAVKNVRALHRLILSGTPIQNNVLELWSLFDFLMPGFLGQQADFNAMYSKPILQSRDAKASSEAQESGILAMEALHRQVLPFILRRLKEDVLQDLPPKIIQDYHCELSPLQRKLYHHFSSQNQDIAKSSDKMHVFNALQYLRKLCSDPQLVLKPTHPLYKPIMADLQLSNSSLDSLDHSPKLLALKELLNECGIGLTESDPDNLVNAAGHRALIFCQMKSTIDLIEEKLFKAFMPEVSYMRMDGQTPAPKRVPMVKHFNDDPTIDCFLLTTNVGGLGLNLTGADTVIFMEHDWNPMKDLQAMDRAHRIGATRTVNVYRLITLNTLEEKIMSLQKFKLQTANTVVNAENQSFATMDTSVLLDLFNLADLSPAAAKEKPGVGGVDSLGNVAVGGAKSVLDSLGELWDDSQYNEEFDAEAFVSSLK